MSFSQLGEDAIIWHLLRERRNGHGIYVDVGAFDPVRYSNTLLLHKAGWSGINIDPNPEVTAHFRAARPRDINIHAAVSNIERQVEYVIYPGTATNRIIDPSSQDVTSVLGEDPLRRVPMRTRTLSGILSEYVEPAEEIDFLNVDCEGEDLNVLEGMDWNLWKPRVVCVEAHGLENQRQIAQFMAGRNYEQVAQMLVSFIFRRIPNSD